MGIKCKVLSVRKLGHIAISASAGSGKTFQLSHRYIRLLAEGISPDRICALTFSRKAAGEIFDSVVGYLCEAAASEDGACDTAMRIECPEFRQSEFLRVLRNFLTNLHRMHVGTLDSFIIGVVRTFPTELGIASSFRIMDNGGAEASELRDRILLRIFDPRLVDTKTQRLFFEAFKMATFGQDEKAMGKKLNDFIEKNRNYYLVLPQRELWGKESVVWPQGMKWGAESRELRAESGELRAESGELRAESGERGAKSGDPRRSSGRRRRRADFKQEEAEATEGRPGAESGEGGAGKVEDIETVGADLMELIGQKGLPEKVVKRWRTFTDAVCKFGVGLPWAKEIEYLFEKLIPLVGDLEKGCATVSLEKKSCELGARECGCVLALLHHIMRAELEAAIRRTKGIYSVLSQYEDVYDSQMRTYGKFTFDDAQYLLTEANSYSDGALISRDANEDGRLYIDYRLDCKLDHWLLDEFQDTSDLQWSVLSNLADEILQDDSGSRSFFYVGDVKQAIYGWRGGNAGLFGNILKQYGARINEHPLSVSFRSCRPVIDTVNCVFGNLASESGLPLGTVRAWQEIWCDHCSAKTVADMSGYTALLEPAYDGKKKPGSEDRYAVAAGVLKQVDPLRHGLDVAILVRSNRAGYDVVDYLRRACPEMPIVHEGNMSIVDNPAVSVLLSLITFAAHPGDIFAWRHLQMSPLSSTEDFRRTTQSGLSLRILRSVHEHGFQQTIKKWGELLKTACKLDPFGVSRIDELLSASAEFDSTGNRDCDSFVLYVNKHEVREIAAASAVRVMTIHQSKGLGFDMVILPELMSKTSIVKDHNLNFVMAQSEEREDPLWALSMPRRVIAENDETLGEQVLRRDNSACFDALCVLYVAMTRAKRALYMITSYPGKSAKTLNEAAFLKTVLAKGSHQIEGIRDTVPDCSSVCLYENGRRDWYEDVDIIREKEKELPSSDIPSGFSDKDSSRTRLLRVEPSAEKEVVISAAQIFASDMGDILSFGNAIHAMFEEVEWYETSDADLIVENWISKSDDFPSVQKKICDQFRKALGVPGVQKELSKPDCDAELWREKSFEIVLEGKWVTGQFDRVTVLKDETGKPVEAVILDYKSNRIDSEKHLMETAEEYRSQLALYSRALSRILKIPEKRIFRRLLFTEQGRVVDL